MTLQFNKRLIYITVGLLVLLLLVFVFLYYIVLSPLHNEVKQISTQLENERKLVATLEKKVNDSQVQVEQGTTDYQRKVPVKPFLEQFLLDLEKAEVTSKSFISSMNFGQADLTGLPTENTGENQESTMKFPEGMKRLTVSLAVQSPNYFALEEFLQTLESMERITKVDSLSFAGVQEISSIEQEIPKLTYSVTISAFYHPGLEELKDELPPFIKPEPSNKKNPFAHAGDLSEVEEDEKVSDSKVNEQSENMPIADQKKEAAVKKEDSDVKIIYYKVKPEDTLYRISQRFYKSRQGEEIIRNWNGLDGNKVIKGQTLKIPIEK